MGFTISAFSRVLLAVLVLISQVALGATVQQTSGTTTARKANYGDADLRASCQPTRATGFESVEAK